MFKDSLQRLTLCCLDGSKASPAFKVGASTRKPDPAQLPVSKQSAVHSPEPAVLVICSPHYCHLRGSYLEYRGNYVIGCNSKSGSSTSAKQFSGLFFVRLTERGSLVLSEGDFIKYYSLGMEISGGCGGSDKVIFIDLHLSFLCSYFLSEIASCVRE